MILKIEKKNTKLINALSFKNKPIFFILNDWHVVL